MACLLVLWVGYEEGEPVPGKGACCDCLGRDWLLGVFLLYEGGGSMIRGSGRIIEMVNEEKHLEVVLQRYR